MNDIHIIPIRHHSPAAAAAVERTILDTRPRLVLIEGPSDATDLIPLLLQPDTRPPVAILAYRPAAEGRDPATLAVPFCDYSPELVAMRTAARVGAAIRFCDAPAGVWLDREPSEPESAGREALPDAAPSGLFQALADRFGFSTHEEFWDSRFEMANPEPWRELMGSYGEVVREWLATYHPGNRLQLDRARESWMLREVDRAIGESYRPEEILLMCGAAHETGLRIGAQDASLVEAVEGTAPVRFALIPYSYPRLSEQSGYGAGNRAPAFYQEVWRRRGDWNGAALGFLLRLMNRLRGRGYALSLADAIEARRLAANLAGLRDKPSAGIEEVVDAAVACYGRDGYDPRPALMELLIGEEVGAVSSMAARTALQQEFLDQVKRYGIPFADSPRELRLNLANASDRAPSVFLHRLSIAAVPFARLNRTGSILSGRKDTREDPLERLMALREKWEVRWTPATDIRLIELAVFGNSLAEVDERLLRRRLEAARNLEEVAGVLLDVVVARIGSLYDPVVAACETISGEDDDFGSLSRASYLLDTLIGYSDLSGQADLLAKLGDRVFARASLLLPEGAEVSDEEAARAAEGVKLLHQVASRRRRRGESDALLAERLQLTAEGRVGTHPSLSGLASTLLYLDGLLSDEELSRALGLRLSWGEEPLRAAQFVEGLFSLNRSVLVRNRALVGSLSDFLVGLPKEAFVAVLPVLRRSLAGLSPGEMGYLVDTIAAVLGMAREIAEKAGPDAAQLQELAALDKELGDLFG